jgi:heme-degrading monooxygenase HmoA
LAAVDQRPVESAEDGLEVRGGAPPHRPDRQREVETGDAAHAQPGAEGAPGEDASRDQPEAALAGHEGKLELVGVGLHGHAHAQVGGEQGPLQERARRAALRVQDPADIAQGRQLEGAGSPTPRADHHEALVAEPGGRQSRGQPLRVREQDDGAVEGLRPHPLEEVTTPAGAEAEGDTRERVAHTVDPLGERDFGEGVRDADADLPPGESVTVGGGADVAHRVQHAPAALEHRLAGLGQREGAPSAIAERNPEGALEALHAACHRRLGEVQHARGAADRARIRHRHEGPDVVEFHGDILVMSSIHGQHGARAGILSRMPTSSPPVVRSWSARATAAGAEAYLEHFERAVLPVLRGLAGHRGVLVLRRPENGEVGITVLTLWASLEAVHEFAGPDASVAVVEPEARATLTAFDARAVHFELVLRVEA